MGWANCILSPTGGHFIGYDFAMARNDVEVHASGSLQKGRVEVSMENNMTVMGILTKF